MATDLRGRAQASVEPQPALVAQVNAVPHALADQAPDDTVALVQDVSRLPRHRQVHGCRLCSVQSRCGNAIDRKSGPTNTCWREGRPGLPRPSPLLSAQ